MEWSNELAYDVANGVGKDTVCRRHGISMPDLVVLYRDSAFRMAVARHSNTIQEKGHTFKDKAQFKAESYIGEIDDLIHSPDTPAMVKLEAIKAMVKWAGLDGKENTTRNQTLIQNKIEIGWLSDKNPI